MAVKPFSKEQLNFFKFSSIILDEFPKAVRHIFVTLWDSKIAVLPGYQVWDDSTAVRNMLLKREGGKTGIPINQSIGEWDCTALFQATIYAKTFGSLSGKGPTKTLNDLYLKKKKPAAVLFHPSVNSPTGNRDETYALAIDQIRLLRNKLCHSAKSEIVKADFDQFVQLAKDALTAAKLSTTSIDGIGGLTEDDFPTEKVTKLNELVQEELQSMNRFLQDNMKETTSGIDERTREIKETTSGIDQTTREIKETTSDIDKKMKDMICDMHKLMRTSGEPTHTICKDSTPDSLPKSHLPPLVPHFTGRETECEKISSLMISKSKQLFNIWGSPGFGKTSTAIAVAHHLQSLGHPIYFSTFRGKTSKDELISKLLSIFNSFSKSNAITQLTPSDQLCSIFREIPCRLFLVLDNLDDLLASKPNDSATSSVKDEVTDFIQDVLVSCKNVSFLTTTRESLEFMRLKGVRYESLRIVPLDQLSSSKLISKLLLSPPPENVVLDVIKITGSVPLAIKLVCSLLSENMEAPKEVLDDLRSSTNLLEMLDNPDYSNDLRLQKLIDSSFERLSSNEKEALISLILFRGDINSDAAVAVIGGNKTVARRTLNILNRKSLIDQDSDSKVFSLHPLIQSFAVEKTKNELKVAAVSAVTRFSKYYLFLFEDLNEQFLTGNSLKVCMTPVQEKKNICQSFVTSLSNPELREKALGALAKAELLVQLLFRSNITDHVYEVAIETAKKSKNDSAYCKLVVGQFFLKYIMHKFDTISLIPKGVREIIALLRDGTAAKLLCYEGFQAIAYGETKRGVSLLTEGFSGLGKNSDEQILKCITLQLLSVYHNHSHNLDRSAQFSQMALDQCKDIGVSGLFIIGEYETSTDEEKRSDTHLQSQPLILDIVFRLSYLAGNILSDKMKDKFSNTVCEIQRELQLQDSNELYEILEIGDAALSCLSVHGRKTRLDETIQSIKTELEKEEDNDDQGNLNESTSKNTMRRTLLKERLAKCYRYKSYYHSKTNEKDLTLKSLQHSLDVNLNLIGKNRNATAACYHEIGTEQNKMGEYISALESLLCALDIRLKLYGKQHSDTAKSYLMIGDTHFKMENYTSALEAQQHSLEIRLKLHGEQHLTTAWMYFLIGMTQFYMRDYTSALESQQHALDIRLKLHDEQDVNMAYSYLSIGMTQVYMRNYKAALDSNYHALKIFINLCGEIDDVTCHCYRFIGIVWRALGNKKLALNNCQRALDIRSKIYEEDHALIHESRIDVFAILNDVVFLTC